MATIILDPVDTLSLSSPGGPIAKRLFNAFTHMVLRSGGKMYRARSVRTKDADGNVISLDTEVLPFDGFFFDSFTSEILTQAGVSDRTETSSGGRDVSRAYIHEGVDVIPGDYILWQFDENDESYDGRYEVVEKEAHNVQGNNIFHTLYLEKRAE